MARTTTPGWAPGSTSAGSSVTARPPATSASVVTLSLVRWRMSGSKPPSSRQLRTIICSQAAPGWAVDQRLAREPGELHRLSGRPGGGMLGREHELHRLAPEVVALHAERAGEGLALPLVGQDEVEVAERQRRQRLLGLGFHELAAQLGRLERQALHRRHGEAERRRLERGDPGPAGHAPRRRGQLGLRQLRALEQGAGVADEDQRGVGEPHAAPGRLEQRHSRLALQHGELLGDGGGRELERVGHRGDRAAGVQLVEQPQPAQVEHSQVTLLHLPNEAELFLRNSRGTMVLDALARSASLSRLRRRLRRDGGLRQAGLRRGRDARHPARRPLRARRRAALAAAARNAAASGACARSRAGTCSWPWRSEPPAMRRRPAATSPRFERLDPALLSLLVYTYPRDGHAHGHRAGSRRGKPPHHRRAGACVRRPRAGARRRRRRRARPARHRARAVHGGGVLRLHHQLGRRGRARGAARADHAGLQRRGRQPYPRRPARLATCTRRP